MGAQKKNSLVKTELGTPWDELTQETGDRKLRPGNNAFQREDCWGVAAMKVPGVEELQLGTLEELQQGTLGECLERENVDQKSKQGNVWVWWWRRQDQWDVTLMELIE